MATRSVVLAGATGLVGREILSGLLTDAAFRHIVATAILKASPNDWQTAALVLHDRVETVQKHYAHLQSADGTRRLHSLFEQTFARA